LGRWGAGDWGVGFCFDFAAGVGAGVCAERDEIARALSRVAARSAMIRKRKAGRRLTLAGDGVAIISSSV
jgi:hypothetical protein